MFDACPPHSQCSDLKPATIQNQIYEEQTRVQHNKTQHNTHMQDTHAARAQRTEY